VFLDLATEHLTCRIEQWVQDCKTQNFFGFLLDKDAFLLRRRKKNVLLSNSDYITGFGGFGLSGDYSKFRDRRRSGDLELIRIEIGGAKSRHNLSRARDYVVPG
jgi:hypothetical protein